MVPRQLSCLFSLRIIAIALGILPLSRYSSRQRGSQLLSSAPIEAVLQLKISWRPSIANTYMVGAQLYLRWPISIPVYGLTPTSSLTCTLPFSTCPRLSLNRCRHEFISLH
ncbi:hypothetical protein KP509_15G007900 [Ceratopteris richardii]|uniref:Uncharacterized protein n=1 Tax=Ceratopteris richardii TaxID=49495 RepID=A0A8T2T2S5_CERRI|nr:hypothetical protein KP509_15G007900 [Ceratopteris richardii]